MLLEPGEIKNTTLGWLPPISRHGYFIYWLVIALFLTGFCSLFLIHIDISVRSNGIISSINERADIRSPVSGIIDSVFCKEGDLVAKNSIILIVRDPTLNERRFQNETEISLCQDFIHDLGLLTSGVNSVKDVQLLRIPFYRQEAKKFFSRVDEQDIFLSKANHEKTMNEKLVKDKVISPEAYYDICIQEQKIISRYHVFRDEQFVAWHTDLVRYRADLKQHLIKQNVLSQQFKLNRIRTSVSGWLQNLDGHYPGNAIQAGESICTVSPDGLLIGECYVSSKDIGMLEPGQPVKFQVDAFNHNYFGAVTGSIYSIDKDFAVLEKIPVFRIKCRLNQQQLKLSNGFSGELKKGMSFKARFIVCNRTLWQLLTERLDNWLYPVR